MSATTGPVKERPILFSGPMVRAILEGRKTQTRRVIKKHPLIDAGFTDEFIKHPGNASAFICPYGQPGDRLWVRESFQPLLAEGVKWEDADYSTGEGYAINYVTTSSVVEFYDCRNDKAFCDRVTPSIFMPRWASRITLEITDVRVQRLQEISEEDAKAEGLDDNACAAVLTEAAGKLEPDEAYYVTDATEADVTEGYLCYSCAKKQQKKHGKDAWVHAAACPESDGPAYCDECNRPLYISLTAYGIESELFLNEDHDNRKHFSATGLNAAIAGMIAGGIGDLRDEHRGRLAQIGFATLWDSINAKRGFGWDVNPWVWAISFKVVRP